MDHGGEEVEFVADEAPTADQRASVAKEMTNLLHRHIADINKRFEVRRLGAKQDLNPKTDIRSSTMSNADASASQAPASGLDTGSQHAGSAQPQRRFNTAPKDEERITLTQRRGSVMSMEGHSPTDPGKAVRLDRFKDIFHHAESTLMSRMVDNIVFSCAEKPPFDIPVKDIAGYVCEAIICQYSIRHFRHFMKRALACSILQNCFWYVYCHTFQPHSEQDKAVLAREIGKAYVKLVEEVTTNKDYFFQLFPYAIAHGVYVAFHYYIPGSRARYTPTFRLESCIVVCRMLSGLDLCPVTVQRMQDRLLAEEPLGLNSTKIAEAEDAWVPPGSEVLGPDLTQKVRALHSLAPSMTLPGLFPADSGKPPGSARSASGSEGVSEPASDSVNSMTQRLRNSTRQLRQEFGVASLSPLVQTYLQHPTASGHQAVMLKRTTPAPWLRIGGVETFRSTVVHSYSQEDLRRTHADITKELKDGHVIMRTQLGEKLVEIRKQQQQVLQGGVANVSRFLLDINQQRRDERLAKHDRRKPKRAGLASDASGVGVLAPAKTSTLVNTLPSPSPLTSFANQRPLTVGMSPIVHK